MFPGVAPKFFAERPEGPRNVGKDPAEVAADELSKASGTGPVHGPIRYSVTLGGKAHHVTVERARA
jgi:methylmalonyl-CoA carboxyltransferase 5S subunit